MSSFSTSCFWALLSPERLEFLYLPRAASRAIINDNKSVTDLLMHRSLLDFVHPDELDSAQTDFARFLSARVPAGSITRCRLRSFSNLALRHEVSSKERKDISRSQSSPYTLRDLIATPEWAIVDVVMYIASESFVLAFFHDPVYFKDSGATQTQCGQLGFETDEIARLFDLFDRCCALPSPTSLFQIYEDDRLHVSWPRQYDSHEVHQVINHIVRKEVPSCTSSRCSKGCRGCTHHHYSSSIEVLTAGLFRIERIIIPYGHIIFAAFQLSPVSSRPRQQVAFYKHYVHCHASSIQNQQDTFGYASGRTMDFGDNTHTAITATSNSMSINKLLLNSETSASATLTTSIATANNDTNVPHTSNQETLLVALKSAMAAMTTENIEARVCVKCHTHSSPEWRKGPSGSKTLCNACGLRFSRSLAKKKRLYQSQLHSSQ
ncbi:hypothetical protein BX666DRAFT_1916371 [Dichotomocladium elegans]|nr:hypothetical protein BX666DRAFT_1916371 [Dichotomocladium elegans]